LSFTTGGRESRRQAHVRGNLLQGNLKTRKKNTGKTKKNTCKKEGPKARNTSLIRKVGARKGQGPGSTGEEKEPVGERVGAEGIKKKKKQKKKTKKTQKKTKTKKKKEKKKKKEEKKKKSSHPGELCGGGRVLLTLIAGLEKNSKAGKEETVGNCSKKEWRAPRGPTVRKLSQGSPNDQPRNLLSLGKTEKEKGRRKKK